MQEYLYVHFISYFSLGAVTKLDVKHLLFSPHLYYNIV